MQFILIGLISQYEGPKLEGKFLSMVYITVFVIKTTHNALVSLKRACHTFCSIVDADFIYLSVIIE